MEYCHRPEIVTFKGEEAKEILESYIMELEERSPEELTEAQSKIMIRVAESLISAIEAEPRTQCMPKQKALLPTIAEGFKGLFKLKPDTHRESFTKPNITDNPHHHAR